MAGTNLTTVHPTPKDRKHVYNKATSELYCACHDRRSVSNISSSRLVAAMLTFQTCRSYKAIGRSDNGCACSQGIASFKGCAEGLQTPEWQCQHQRVQCPSSRLSPLCATQSRVNRPSSARAATDKRHAYQCAHRCQPQALLQPPT
eukprot:4406106-Pleurochrysis_carterae.AAC.6